MASKNPQKQQQREHAKLLYCNGDLTQNEIAAAVGVNNKTISAWVREGLWDSLRKSLLTSKTDQIRILYEFMDKLNIAIKEADYGTPEMATMMLKYSTSIKNLQTELDPAAYYETGMRFINHVRKTNDKLAKEITSYFHAFISEELNNKF